MWNSTGLVNHSHVGDDDIHMINHENFYHLHNIYSDAVMAYHGIYN